MGGTGSGRKKAPGTQLRDAIEEIDVSRIVKNLEGWSKGKEVICPKCLEHTGVYVPDTVALQSAIELLNRRLGKPVQRQEIDVTSHVQLNADQIDQVLRNHLPQIVELYRSEIMLLTQGKCDIIDTEVIE